MMNWIQRLLYKLLYPAKYYVARFDGNGVCAGCWYNGWLDPAVSIEADWSHYNISEAIDVMKVLQRFEDDYVRVCQFGDNYYSCPQTPGKNIVVATT